MEFIKEFDCDCGKKHVAKVDDVIIGNGVINKICEIILRYNKKKPFVVSDANTEKVAGLKVYDLLSRYKMNFSKFVFNNQNLEPNEESVGSLMMHFDLSCDIIIGIGSGVINDICKILASISKLPFIIVATSPSMDGYASNTSSMVRDSLKVSINSKCANVIIGDIDILKTAPKKMMLSGLGDMIAKYVSICEWRISNLINGEYYCEKVASIIRNAVKKCVDNAEGLINGDGEAIKTVFEGLVLGGVCMNYAGCSRPASGVEHYFSHIFDMRALEFNSNSVFHGIQCAIGTLYAIKVYEKILSYKIDKNKALDYVKRFDYEKYKDFLMKFLRKSAKSMIELEVKERKYDINLHKERLKIILENFEKIKEIIREELISYDKLKNLMISLNMPTTASMIGIDEKTVKDTFVATKDIRDKYVLSRFCFDLGIIEDIEF